jgi:hypothetical protein
MQTALSTTVHSTQVQDDFGALSECIQFGAYLNRYALNKQAMAFNYIMMRRLQRSLKAHQSVIFASRTAGLPALTTLKHANDRLNADHWSHFLHDSRLFVLLTSERQIEWQEQIDALDVPAFEEKNIIAVTNDIFANAHTYFAERIIYVMSKLSKDHVTNSQFGFGETIIIQDIHEGSTKKDKYPSFDTELVGAVDELRKIVAFLKHKDLRLIDKEEKLNSSGVLDVLLKRLVQERKADHHIDQNSIQIRLFLKGTIHLNIEPEIAQQMNMYVASLYPNQIPSTLKRKSYFKKPSNSIVLTGTPIHKTVVDGLYSMIKNHFYSMAKSTRKLKESTHRTVFSFERIIDSRVHYMFQSHLEQIHKAGTFEQFIKAVKAIGGTPFIFDETQCILFEHTELENIIDEIVITGLLDDQKTYQQYYTNQRLAKLAHLEIANRLDSETYKNGRFLEPSCGQADLLRLLPKAQTLGLDISATNVALSNAYGYNAQQVDFIEYAKRNSHERFDGILMNPPFTLNQAYNHTMAAYSLLGDNGVLSAILPSGLRDSFYLLKQEGCHISTSFSYIGQFEDTKISVFILTLQNKK